MCPDCGGAAPTTTTAAAAVLSPAGQGQSAVSSVSTGSGSLHLNTKTFTQLDSQTNVGSGEISEDVACVDCVDSEGRGKR